MAAGYSGKNFGQSLAHYVGGRVSNAAMAFFIFAWVARYLPEQHYANYIAAYACLELGLVIFGFGMEWVTAVFIPQVKVKASSSVLRRFVWECAAIQAALLFAGACTFALLAPILAQWLGLENASDVFRLYALVMFVEGMSRVFRDQLLSCLLQQGASQLSQFARNVLMLGFALLLSSEADWRTASMLARAELFASAVSLLLAMLFLASSLRSPVNEVVPHDDEWQRPGWPGMLRAGRNAWLSNLANLSWGGQAVILLVTRLIGSDATAALGFARNLSEQVRRYLPMEFLLGIVRTFVIAHFAQDGNAKHLALRAGLMYRLNLLFLLPLIVLVALKGDELCALLSHGRYANAQWLLFGWLFVLVFWAHHRLSDLMAHALKRSGVTTRVGLCLLITPAFLALAAYFRLWPMVFLVLALAELSYSAGVISALGIYRFNIKALFKLSLTVIPCAVVVMLPFWPDGLLSILSQLVCIYGLVAGSAFLLRAWSTEESEVFPWARRAIEEA